LRTDAGAIILHNLPAQLSGATTIWVGRSKTR
jgi:hypothetical protein